MFARQPSFSVLYGIQRNLLAAFYLISAVSLFWLLFHLICNFFLVSGTVMVLVAVLYLVVIVLGYCAIHVISYIPANLAGAFDPIKNGIADGSIGTADELSAELAEFMCSFFDFAFFDISHALVSLGGKEPVASGGDKGKVIPEKDELEAFAGSLKEAAYFGRVGTSSGNRHLYVIPLIFGEKKLGFIAVLTRQRLWGIFIRLLVEFEKYFVDDQVVHVLAREADPISRSPSP